MTVVCNFDALALDLRALEAEYIDEVGQADFEHLRKLERWVRAWTAAGYATAWIAPNPISAFCLSAGTFGRWAILSHHILHRAFDRLPGVPTRYTSKGWARGRARWRDWLDWIDPEAWQEEHNILHHYRLGEEEDPDLVEDNLAWLRDSAWPVAARVAVVTTLGAAWKPTYYAANALSALRAVKARRAREAPPREDLRALRSWMPWSRAGRDLWTKSWLPYVSWRFGLAPALFLPLGPWASFSVWANSVMAELMTNWHAFLVIVPNHAGDDVMRFEGPTRSRGEFYYRQITGSVNYRTGGDLNDFMHGWLNYQIEHHLFPRATPRQLQVIQPHVEALCRKHGLPYHQGSVFERFRKMIQVAIGTRSMKREDTVAEHTEPSRGESRSRP